MDLSLFFVICLMPLLVLGDQVVQVTINSDADTADPTYSPRHLGGSLYSTRFDDVRWDNEKWTLTTSSARPSDFRAVSFVANGYFGHSFSSIGPFVQKFGNLSGWPLFNERQTFGTISGFYDQQPTTNSTNFPWLEQYGWDSAISGTPNWGPIIIELEDGTALWANASVETLSKITLTQNYQQGFAEWQYTWIPGTSNNLSFDITYTAAADKLLINRGYVQLQIQPSADCNLTLVNVLDGLDALRTDFRGSGTDTHGIYSAFAPAGVPNVTAWVYGYMSGIDASSAFNVSSKPYIGNDTNTIAQGFNVTLKAGQKRTITKFVGAASSDAFRDPQIVAQNAAMQGMADGFEKSFSRHVDEWATVMPKSAVADYSDPETGLLSTDPVLIEKTITNVVSVFGLLMNTVSRNATRAANGAPINSNGMSVAGLSSDSYAGQRFWDQDVWMHPYIAAVFPFEAQQITNSRVQQYLQAKANVKTAYQSSKNTTTFSPDSGAYPWTSGRTANCTASGPCFDYEYHLNGDISHSFVTTWAASGDTEYFRQSLFAPMQSISSFFSDLLVENGDKYSLTNMTDPVSPKYVTAIRHS